MHIQSLVTPRIEAGQYELLNIIDQAVKTLEPNSVLAITSKIVSLCEGSVVPMAGTDKTELMRRMSEQFVADEHSKWGVHFTITNGMLIPTAGIDESNAGDVYVLWPRDAQETANQVRQHLTRRFGHGNAGVVITDSTVRPMRRGVSGIALAYSGFKPLKNYVQSPDLFGRPFKVSQADIVGGLAGAAVLAMGEGAESTPLAVISDLTMVQFVDRNPLPEELRELTITLEDDIFAPFLTKVRWQPGGQSQ